MQFDNIFLKIFIVTLMLKCLKYFVIISKFFICRILCREISTAESISSNCVLLLDAFSSQGLELWSYRNSANRKLFFFGSWSAASIQGRKLFFFEFGDCSHFK